MINVTKIEYTDEKKKTAKVTLFADTRAEVDSLTDYNEVIGMPKDFIPDFGSSVFTTGQELAFMKSDGTWNWGD